MAQGVAITGVLIAGRDPGEVRMIGRDGIKTTSPQGPLLAISGHAEGFGRESALPPKADIRIQEIVRAEKADIRCLLNPRKRT